MPSVNPDAITPHTEAFQAVIWHLLVSHPTLQTAAAKWESTPMSAPAVFLDRDGVLNRAVVRAGKPYPPVSVPDLEILPDVAPALRRLKAAGYRLVVVTNQPDVARGQQRRDVVEGINAALAERLPVDEIRVCYHDDADGCGCRKPEPGLLLQAPAHDLGRSVMVGDRWRDVEAGRRAGVRATVLIERGYDELRIDPTLGLDRLPRRPVDSPPGPWERTVKRIDLRVRLFADGADLADMAALRKQPIRGFTTTGGCTRRAFAITGSSRDVLGPSPSPDLVRGALRRLRGNGRPGARDRGVGTMRLREDSGDDTRAGLHSISSTGCLIRASGST